VTQPPVAYAELLDILNALPVLVRETRRRKEQTLREAGDEVGVSAATMMRWERQLPEQADIVIRLLRWVST
jgi:transcriptional regulator with XRE-family HTH domain